MASGAASGKGCREEVPARVGVGGQSQSRGSDQGSAARRAGGFQLPRDSRGLATGRPQIVPGPKCQQRGVPTGGFRDALCTGPPPPPPSSTLGSLGWDQAFGNQSAAALEPALQAVNQVRGGWRWGRGWGRLGWLVASFSSPRGPHPLAAVKPPADSRQSEEAGR